MNKKFVLFDFDGVIVDSFALALEINKKICPFTSVSEYKKRFEGNINEYLEEKTNHGDQCRHDLDFFDEYVPRMKNEVKLVPGIELVIQSLAEKYNLIIVSSTLSAPISELLDKYNLKKYFLEVMGNDVHKSKVEKIKMVFSKYSVTKEDCVFITDTLGDLREANHVGVKCIAVTWGFHAPETLEKGNPYLIANKVDELQGLIYTYFT